MDTVTWFFSLVRRQKWVIFAVTSLALVVCAVSSLRHHSLYESVAAIEIGSVRGAFIEDPVVMQKRLSLAYPTVDVEALEGTGVIVIRTTSGDPRAAEASLSNIMNDVLAQHEVQFAYYEDSYRKHIALLESLSLLFQSESVAASQEVRSVFFGEHALSAQDELFDMQKEFAGLTKTQVVREPGSTFILWKNLLVAVLLGLFIGILLALAREAGPVIRRIIREEA